MRKAVLSGLTCVATAIGVSGGVAAASPAGADRADRLSGLGPAPARSAPADAVARGSDRLGGERLIVHWRPRVDARERRRARRSAGVALGRTLGDRDFQVLDVAPGAAAAAVAELRRNPDVASVARAGFARLQAVPDDPGFELGLMWGLANDGGGVAGFPGIPVAGADIDALTAWSRTVGSPSVVVAVIDSGIRADHPDLSGVPTVAGYDFVGANADEPEPDPDPADEDVFGGGHGTHVAGTIGAEANNGEGIAGVAQAVTVMPLRVCAYSPAAADIICPHEAIVEAIFHARDQGARVANLSLSGRQFSQPMRDALASSPGVLFVAAAGNAGGDNDSEPAYPCSYGPEPVDNVLCVAATDQADELAGFSNRGAVAVDLGAPGDRILSTYPLQQWDDDPVLADSFDVDDFESRWAPTAGTGFERTNEPPLAPSYGITDSDGGDPVGGSVVESTSEATTLPPGYTDCVLFQWLSVSPGAGGEYRYSVLLDGQEIDHEAIDYDLETDLPRLISAPELAAGGELALRVRYSAGPAPQPGAGEGAWVDDIEVFCVDRDQAQLGYAYLNGTSMAAPHVSGTAALALSVAPGLTVTELRSLLLDSVDPVPGLSGQLATGGRLDAGRAVAAAAAPSPPPPTPLAPAAPTPVPPAGPVAVCRVPNLAGRRLRQARRALRRANCRAGKVVRQPRRARGRLVVRATRPTAGARRRAGARVRIVVTTVKRYRAVKRRAALRRANG